VWGRLPLPWGIQAEGSLWAQGSLDPLPEGEQIWFGGDRLGRGLDRGRVSGDHAIVLSAEASRSFVILNDRAVVTPYVLVDAAHLRTLASPRAAASFVTAGAGARLDFFDRVAMEAEIAKPIYADEPAKATPVQHRITMSVAY